MENLSRSEVEIRRGVELVSAWIQKKRLKDVFLHIDGSQIKKSAIPKQGVNRKVVDNDENYLSMRFQPKLMTRSRENGQKLHFLKNCL